MKKLEDFLKKYFPEEYAAPFGKEENTEDKAIRILCYTHECRRGQARGATLNGIMACQLVFARRAIEKMKKGNLSPDAAAQMLADTVDSMTKDALVHYISEQEGAGTGEPRNDQEFDPYHWKKEKEDGK